MRVPYCARYGLPTALEMSVCERCKNVDLDFESVRVPLQYEGAGKKVVHTLK